MPTLLNPQIKVIGVGNAWRGDDAAGLLVARQLREEPWPGVTVCESQATPGELQGLWQAADAVIIVDTVASGGPPGAIYRFDAHGGGIPAEMSRSASSHGWGVAEALALGRVFQDLPPLLIIYGIEGENCGPGTDLSPAVAAAIPVAARRIKEEIQEWLETVGAVREPPLP